MILCWSRWRLWWFTTSVDREHTFEGIVRFFEAAGGVWFDGPLRMGMQVCLHARVAVRVLMQIATFEADSTDAIYQGARALDWTTWLTAKSTLAVHATVRDSPVTHSGYAALKVKDAVVDALRDKLGARPDVDPKSPDVSIVRRRCAVSS